VSLLEEIQMLGDRVKKTVQLIQTEEATKQAFVIPFIKMLGYDVYDPSEVVPEYIADIGIENGGKIDYAIMKEGKPEILVECKWCGIEINNRHAIQLYRYFPSTPARITLLTNGVIFRFFSDSEKTNQMDSKPFLEIDLRNIEESVVSRLEKLTKSHFNLEELIPTSGEEEPISETNKSKYIGEINTLFSKQLEKPSNDFVKFVVSQLYPGRVTQNVLDEFRGITKEGLGEFINYQITKRLKLVIDSIEGNVSIEPPQQNKVIASPKQIRNKASSSDKPTRAEVLDGRSRYQNRNANITSEKIKAFKIIRSAVKEVVDIKRIFYRETGNFFTVIFDDNRRKPICHLRLGPRKKHIIFYDQGKNGTRFEIPKVEDIASFTERLQAIILQYKGEQ